MKQYEIHENWCQLQSSTISSSLVLFPTWWSQSTPPRDEQFLAICYALVLSPNTFWNHDVSTPDSHHDPSSQILLSLDVYKVPPVSYSPVRFLITYRLVTFAIAILPNMSSSTVITSTSKVSKNPGLTINLKPDTSGKITSNLVHDVLRIKTAHFFYWYTLTALIHPTASIRY